MLSLLEKIKLLLAIMPYTKGNVTLQREDSMMLGDELSIDLKTSSSKLTSKNNEKVRAKYNTDRVD